MKKGTLIAKTPSGELGAHLHSSVSGTIVAVTDEFIEIQANEVQPDEFVPIVGATPEELIKAAGIVGMGGAGFPTHEKLTSCMEQVTTVIVNAAECEPILAHNIHRIELNPEKIVHGLQYAMEAVNAQKGIIAIKKNHHNAIQSLNRLIDRDDIEIVFLRDLYPMGEERAIIREVLGKIPGTNQLPVEIGVVVLNAETVFRISDAVELKKPVISKDVTIAGRLNSNELVQIFLDVPLGKKVGNVLNLAGKINNDYGELIMGGPFTGKSTTVDAPITKISNGVIVTNPFLTVTGNMGLLVCACGADAERLEEIAQRMKATVVGIEYCKQAELVSNRLKCQNPGNCPGQVQKILNLKKVGATSLLVSTCTDCTNTVMTIAAKLQMPLHHCTDNALRAVNSRLIRKSPPA